MSASAIPAGPVQIGVEIEEQFHTEKQQRHAAKLGMWIWLATELLLFAGLFLVALIIRVQHPDAVTPAARHLKFAIGATNTAVLILSSLSMSGAIEMSRMGWQRGTVRCMQVTAALGTIFLLLKGFEYYKDFDEHMMPFLAWRPYELAHLPASALFVDDYYVATGLHGLHLTTGVAIVLVMAWQVGRPGYLARHQNRIEVLGLYWHFIDLIWMIVFPVLYLLNR
ncbi:cytochrome c oxidase subunit 3 [Rhizosaccharibacter radicis]|uniref:Cytochrome c oxidase subunit 3 n=1 Tax=Rhizosaccharibacter radicis TaxID=2782605 RepID=A0ABT1VTI2_9PROT|nr:cytochrome c oxidase subunit 3 [Acetobacteraceae bacterium KSS12]